MSYDFNFKELDEKWEKVVKSHNKAKAVHKWYMFNYWLMMVVYCFCVVAFVYTKDATFAYICIFYGIINTVFLKTAEDRGDHMSEISFQDLKMRGQMLKEIGRMDEELNKK